GIGGKRHCSIHFVEQKARSAAEYGDLVKCAVGTSYRTCRVVDKTTVWSKGDIANELLLRGDHLHRTGRGDLPHPQAETPMLIRHIGKVMTVRRDARDHNVSRRTQTGDRCVLKGGGGHAGGKKPSVRGENDAGNNQHEQHRASKSQFPEYRRLWGGRMHYSGSSVRRASARERRAGIMRAYSKVS